MPSSKKKKHTKAVKNDFGEKHIQEMERMAGFIVESSENRSPAQVSAILYFRDLNNRVTLDQCLKVMGGTSNEFLVCSMVQNAYFIILRKWDILEPVVKKDFFDYFLGNALLKHRSSMKIRGEMLRGCAKLLKRSIFDSHACDFELLAAKFYVMLSDENIEFHHIMYEFFLKILDEFDRYWRFSDISIPYDFHYKAKLRFESEGLLKIFRKCIHIIPRYCSLVNAFKAPTNVSMMEHFLRMSNIILARNYGVHHFPRKNDASVNGPPKTWRDIFLWKEFLQLFFTLHRFLNKHHTLSALTSSCIAQLMLINNVVLPDTPSNPDSEIVSIPDIPYTTSYDSKAVMPEMYSYCLMISNLLSKHPIQSLARAEGSFATFISLIPILTESFTLKLSYPEEGQEGKDSKEGAEKAKVGLKKCNATMKWAYISAIQHLFKGWLIILQNSEFIVEVANYAIDFSTITALMISSFTQMVFSVPFGDREENSIPLPDREIFKEILLKIGSFSSYILDEMLPKIYTILAETLEEFLQSVNTGLSIEDLENFRENMHWILLIIGYVLVEEDEEHNFVWQSKLVFHYEEVIAGKQNNLDKYVPYIEGCINAPNLLTDPSDVDIVIKIIGTVLAWCALEDTLLKDHGVTVLNIGLCNTSLWCIKRLVSAIGMHIQKFGTADPLAKATENITQLLVDFSLQKSFRVLGIMGDERKTCTDAIELLATLAHVMYHETSKSIFLFSYLSAIKTDQVLVRSALLKVLIQIGSIISDEVKQKTLFEMILVPIRTKFVSMCKDPLERNENFDDLLDCFCAVVHGTNKCTAGFLFEYLRPVLKSSVCLLNEFKDSEIIIGAILQFFDCLTKQINLYCDNHEDMLFIYEMLLLVMRLYEVDHKERYKKLSDKEKASELVLLLEILVNILNKRNQPINWITGELEFTGNRSSIVSTAYNLVICVTGHELLKVPLLRKSFYRFLRYSAEMAPECIVKYSPENLLVTVELLKNGLQVDNEKDDLLCNLKDRFEQEISINSALAIAHLSTYFANTTTKSEMATKMFALVIEPVFLMCLNAPWQEDALSSAISTALYSLLCCDEEGCKMYVKTLLSREDNQSNRGTLRNAFRTLMSFSPGKHPDKNEKHEFRDRLKQFLTQVEGLLAIG